MNKNVKKIIKGIMGLGVMGGAAYIAYKVGESNGESNERIRTMAEFDDDEDINEEDDEEEPDNYYGTCFELKYDEPDDGCVAPVNEAATSSDSDKELSIENDAPDEKNEATVDQPKMENPLPQADNNKTVVKAVAPPVRKYPPLSSINIHGFTRIEIENLLLWMLRCRTFYKVDMLHELHAGSKKVNTIYDAFIKAGYISKDENGKKIYCNLTRKDFCDLFLIK